MREYLIIKDDKAIKVYKTLTEVWLALDDWKRLAPDSFVYVVKVWR